MAEPISTNPATRANAEHNTDTSRIGDDLNEDRAMANVGAGYYTTTASERVGTDRLADVVEEPADEITSDPSVYDVRVIRAGESGTGTSTVGASHSAGYDIDDTQEMPLVANDNGTLSSPASGSGTNATYVGSNAGPFDTATLSLVATPPIATPPSTTDAPSSSTDEVEAARAEVEATRARLAGNVEAIKDKLSPAHLVEEAKEAATHAVAEKVDEVKAAVSDKVSDIAGAVGGVTATVTEKAKELATNAQVAASAAVAQVNELAHSAVEKVQDVLHGAKPKVQNALDTASGRARGTAIQASNLAQSAGQTAKGAGTTVVDTIRLNPLPAALIGIGVGWLILSIRKQDTLATNYEGRLPRRDLIPYDDEGVYTPYGATSGSTIVSATPTYSGSSVGEPGFLDTARDKAGDLASKAGDLTGTARDKALEVADSAREKASDLAETARAKASGVADAAREKAGDLAESAKGLADSAKTKATDITDSAKAKASELAETAKSKAGDFADSAREFAGTARDKAGDLASGAKDKSQQAVSALDTFVHENPIAAGAIALMVGVTVGLLVPGTRKENELLGPTRDRLADQATAKASEVAQKAQKVAEAALGTVKESFDEVKDTVKQQLGEATDTVKQQLGEAKDAVKETLQTEAKNQGLPAGTEPA